MRMFEQINALRTYIRGIRQEGKTVGFVPTMGALHDGHLSVIRKAKADCDVVVVSVFVNPTQFAPDEDLASYPRALAKDQQLCSNGGAAALFVPGVAEMYPDGFQATVSLPHLGSVLEGAHRPGHFDGVATVVLKLLNIVQPDRVYFGQKDYQQVLVIERLVQDLNVHTEVVTVPTVRAADGLALSSRNAYLTVEERAAAPVLYRALQFARDRVLAGETDGCALQREMRAIVADEPLAQADYVSLVHPGTLVPVTSVEASVMLAVLAVRIGTTRLIDNMLIAPPGVPVNRTRINHS